MRLASLATLLAALAVAVAAAAGAAIWSSPATIGTCAPAVGPKVVFPYRTPQSASGRGAILWLGAVPHCGSSPTLDAASLHSDDLPSIARTFTGSSGVLAPLVTAWTSAGQVVAAFGTAAGAVFGEGDAGRSLGPLAPLGGPGGLVATADGYIGDAVVVNTVRRGGEQLIELRPQRHYDGSFERPVTLAVGPAPIVALSVAMDFRADSIVLWAQGGIAYARWITNDRHVFPTRTLGPAGYAPQLAAVLSDNNHAFVMWTDEPPPGSAGTATIYLEHSGDAVTFASPRVLRSFTEPAGQRLTPGAIALERLAPSEGVLAAWTWVSGGDFVVSAAGLVSAGPLRTQTLAQPGADLRLAALASGPRDDAVAVLEQAPRAARGFDATHQAILAARSAGGRVAFETPVQLAPAALNSAPSVAIDPASDRAVVAWQTTPAGGVPQVAYAVRATP